MSVKEKEFTLTASFTSEVMDIDLESAKAWFENYLATESRHIDFDIEEFDPVTKEVEWADVKMIDDLLAKEVELEKALMWSPESIDDIQNAWLNIKNNLNQKKGE